MNVKYNQSVETLKSWGATQIQIDAILASGVDTEDDKSFELNRRQRMIESIDECLQLLFPDRKKRQYFMTHTSNTLFFARRKPLDVLALGSLSSLEQSYQSIRSMLCI
ncbi:hypothetical protein [Vibrio fluminensis]|uniref:hypothetical protein n=1 Tax=Vibrio fluminensis TaxID=2783614 RepID=UPI0018891D5A|nr:hypothetical protein [Vibrio fluminensis]